LIMRKIAVFALVVMLFSISCFAQPAATSEFFVNDFADVLNEETENQILAIGAQLQKDTTAQLVAVTVDTTDGQEINEYTLNLGRKWGVGQEDKNNGVVLLVAVEDREISIQVGYGLEGRLNDSKVGRILDNYAVPYLKDNNFSEGLENAYKALTSEIYAEYDIEMPENFDLPEALPEEDEDIDILSVIIFIIVLLVIFSGGRFLPFFHFGGFHGGGFGGGFRGGSSGGGFRGGGGSFGGGGASRGF